MLGRHIQHSGDFTQDGLAAVLTLVALNGNDPIGFVDGEIDPGELLRPLSAKLDHGFTIGGVADRSEKLVQLLLPLLPPLVGPLGVVSFDVLLQIAGLYVAGLALIGSADVGAVIVVDHCVIVEVVLLRKSGTTARDLTWVRPLARMSPLMLGGVARIGSFLATFVNPAEKLAVGKPLPLRGPALASRGGQGPSELDAPADGCTSGASSEPEAPGDGDEDMDGEEGSDITKMPEGAGECQESPQTSFPSAPGGFSPR
jgi:hypothetical protein